MPLNLVQTSNSPIERLSSLASFPLHNKRVLITAPQQYASKLSSKLIQRGARPLWIPSVQVTELSDPAKLDELDLVLRNLRQYSHILFTSRNGINAVLARLEVLTQSPQAAIATLNDAKAQIYALGADAEVLKALGVSRVQTPLEASTRGLVRHLAPELAGARPLCPVPLVGGGLTEPDVVPQFLDSLRLAGATPDRVDAYLTTVGATAEDVAVERALLEGGKVDAIVFSSTAEAQGLVSLLTKKTIRDAVGKGCILSAHGPYTAKGVTRALDLPVELVGKDFSSFDGVVKALEEHYRQAAAAAAAPLQS